jgi:hypothetical protein
MTTTINRRVYHNVTQIFDGQHHRLVEPCCEGQVNVRTITEARARKHACDGGVILKVTLHCAKCDRQLVNKILPRAGGAGEGR